MKTLKYLMLLLAVALALPAMAQEKKAIKETEKAAWPVVINEKASIKDKAKDVAVTTGRLNKADYAVQVLGDGTLVASVRMDQGMILTLEKRLDGSARKICEGKGKKGVCPHGFTYEEEALVDEVAEEFAAEEEWAWER